MLQAVHICYSVQTKVTFLAYQKEVVVAKDFGAERATLMLVK